MMRSLEEQYAILKRLINLPVVFENKHPAEVAPSTYLQPTALGDKDDERPLTREGGLFCQGHNYALTHTDSCMMKYHEGTHDDSYSLMLGRHLACESGINDFHTPSKSN